jgi:hypothetical protein
MSQNMGWTDRMVRALLAAPVLAIAALWVGVGTVVGVIAMVLAVVMVATALVGFCPLYVPFHLHTNGHHRAT